MRLVASVATAGNAGFEAFRLPGSGSGGGGGGGGGGGLYLAAANFWDGASADMSARSVVFKVETFQTADADDDDDDDGALVLARVQSMRTQGAHGWDFVRTAHGDRLLVVPNYYGCGSGRGPATGDCASTVIYRWREDKHKFVRTQALRTAGPGQTDHFTVGEDTYLVVGENFDDKVTVWKDVRRKNRPHFEKLQELGGIAGAGATALCRVDADRLLLVASSYHSGTKERGWMTDTPVFQWSSSTNLGFIEVPVQWIEGHGTHDVECASFRGRHYLFLSEDRDDTGPKIHSKVMLYDSGKARYVEHQRLPTDGAHAAEFFQMWGAKEGEGEGGKGEKESSLWLAIANFGDRMGKRYESESTVWRQASSCVDRCMWAMSCSLAQRLWEAHGGAAHLHATKSVEHHRTEAAVHIVDGGLDE